jgi:hypothetical protein
MEFPEFVIVEPPITWYRTNSFGKKANVKVKSKAKRMVVSCMSFESIELIYGWIHFIIVWKHFYSSNMLFSVGNFFGPQEFECFVRNGNQIEIFHRDLNNVFLIIKPLLTIKFTETFLFKILFECWTQIGEKTKNWRMKKEKELFHTWTGRKQKFYISEISHCTYTTKKIKKKSEFIKCRFCKKENQRDHNSF